eukprot:jgi/Mesen1/9294/ME000060S08736
MEILHAAHCQSLIGQIGWSIARDEYGAKGKRACTGNYITAVTPRHKRRADAKSACRASTHSALGWLRASGGRGIGERGMHASHGLVRREKAANVRLVACRGASSDGTWPIHLQGAGPSDQTAWDQLAWDQLERPDDRQSSDLGSRELLHRQRAEGNGAAASGRSPAHGENGATNGAKLRTEAEAGEEREAKHSKYEANATGAKEGAEGGKGSWVQHPLLRFMQLLKIIRSVLPYGSWWDIGGDDDATGDENFRKGMKRMVSLVAPDWKILTFSFTFLVIAALAEVSIPHYVAATIFSAANNLPTKFNYNARQLALMTVTYGVFSGIRGALFGIANQRLEIAFFDTEGVGDLTSRLGADCQQVSRIIGVDLNIMLRNALQAVGALGYLVTLSWPLALSTAGVSGFLWVLMMIYGRFQRRAAKLTQDHTASANERLIDLGLRKSVAYGFWTWCSNTLYNATQVVALLVGGGYVMAGAISAEQLTKYILYAEWVVHSTWWVGDHWAAMMEAIGASARVFELLDLPKAPQLVNKGKILPKLRGHIEFQNVSFAYPTRPTMPVLTNVSLTFHPGELIALVGLSGSGKSTLIGLLQRLYEPTQGQVLIDGVPLQELDIGWFRQHLGVVSQARACTCPRENTDVAANIAYGASSTVQMDDIRHAARQANADAFIASLPAGYATPVDNARLSGGQKQRIAIARALVRKPAVLVLDEATSALDAESEHNVQVALDRAMRDDKGQGRRTVLVIAHRLSTVRAADRIVVMKGGQVAEVGSHDELLLIGGEYAKLTQRQMNSIS